MLNRDDVKNLIAQSLGIEITDVGETQQLRADLGLDETELTEILSELKSRYNFEFPEEELDQVNTVGELLDLIEQYVSEK